jgi:hypothetical protein
MWKLGFGTEAAQFPEKENINGIFIAVWFSSAGLPGIINLFFVLLKIY